jgi:hypothetical protein
VSTSGGDIEFQGSAIGLDLRASGLTGNVGYGYVEEVPDSYLANFQSQFTGGPLNASSSSPNSVVAAYTNGGNYGVLLVTAQSGTSLRCNISPSP